MGNRTYLSVNVVFLKFMTMYALDEDASCLIKCVYYSWRTFILFSVFIIFPQSIMDIVFKDWQEFIQIAINILNSGIYLCAVIRIGYYMYFSKKVRNLVVKMNKQFLKGTNTNFETYSMEQPHKVAHYFSFIWIMNVLLSTETFVIIPLFFLNKTGRILPLPAWYPFDWQLSPYFEIVYFLQAITNVFMGFAYANVDMFYFSVVYLTVQQVKILASNFKVYLNVALVKFGVPEDKVISFVNYLSDSNGDRNMDHIAVFSPDNIEESKATLESRNLFNEITDVIRSDAFQPYLHKEFFDCVQYHKLLLSFCLDVEDFFAPIVLPIFGFVVFYVIFISFTLITTSNASYSIGLIEYICLALGQTLIYTYFGTTLTHEYLNVKDSLYESPWYLYDRSFKNALLFVHKRLGRPVILTAGKFFPLSLTTYLVILKTCASYFAVLRQVVERKAEEN